MVFSSGNNPETLAPCTGLTDKHPGVIEIWALDAWKGRMGAVQGVP
jgi:hypothetical protein